MDIEFVILDLKKWRVPKGLKGQYHEEFVRGWTHWKANSRINIIIWKPKNIGHFLV